MVKTYSQLIFLNIFLWQATSQIIYFANMETFFGGKDSHSFSKLSLFKEKDKKCFVIDISGQLVS